MKRPLNDDTIIFKVSKDLKKKLQDEARMNNMTLSTYIKIILNQRKK